MRRRQLLATVPPALTLSGCLGSNGCEDDEYTLCEGDRLARVAVNESYPGEVEVRAECRTEHYHVQPGDELELDRREDREECTVRVYADEKQVWGGRLADYEVLSVTIDADGSVDGGTIAV